ncbi:MAG: divalent-cation tolerance protein CutA [Cyanophyceae cyanobacterium]|mgnify:CR=1 FL=1
MATPGIILATHPNFDDAKALAKTLLREKLIACATLGGGRQSVYLWDGKIQEDQEVQLLLKTDLDKFKALETRIKELHPYDVPEILAIAVTQGSSDYLQWIQDCISS